MSASNERILAFTGHRHLTPEETRLLRLHLDRLLKQEIANGVGIFRTGGALGFDTLAAEAVLRKKEEFPSLFLELILPYPGQADSWEEADRRRYNAILQAADRVVYISTNYYDGVLQARNRALIEGASLCVAFLRTSHGGGAAYTAQLALRKGIGFINLYDQI